MKNVVLYHAHCPDGLVSAAVIQHHSQMQGIETEFLAVSHGNPTKEPDYALLNGNVVYIVDFSFPIEVMRKIIDVSDRTYWFDHHATAVPTYEALSSDLSLYSRLTICFDQTRSGAGITWDEVSDQPRPPLINYAEDQDLYRFTSPNSREVNAWLRTQDQTVDRFAELLTTGFSLGDAANQGALIRDTQRRIYAQIGDTGHWTNLRTIIGGDEDLMVPCSETQFGTDVGEYLYDTYPDAPAVMSYHRLDNERWRCSLRSKQGRGIDVRALCERMGGGGHKHAAGFVTTVMPVLGERLKK